MWKVIRKTNSIGIKKPFKNVKPHQKKIVKI